MYDGFSVVPLYFKWGRDDGSKKGIFSLQKNGTDQREYNRRWKAGINSALYFLMMTRTSEHPPSFTAELSLNFGTMPGVKC